MVSVTVAPAIKCGTLPGMKKRKTDEKRDITLGCAAHILLAINVSFSNLKLAFHRNCKD